MAISAKTNIDVRISAPILTSICSLLDTRECPKARLVCKLWATIFTPYNAMRYRKTMNMSDLQATFLPRIRREERYQWEFFGVPDVEYFCLQMLKAFEMIRTAENRGFASLHLRLPRLDL